MNGYGLHTRTISTVADSATLFWEQHPKLEIRQDYDGVVLKFDPAGNKAELHLNPTFMFSPMNRRLTEQDKVPIRERLTLEVKKGELLTAHGRSYKVLNVVPPQDIEGVGHLVGWIELAADPVEPPVGRSPGDTKK